MSLVEFGAMLGKTLEATVNLTSVVDKNLDTAYKIKDKHQARRQHYDWVKLLDLIMQIAKPNFNVADKLSSLARKLKRGEDIKKTQTELRTELQAIAVTAAAAREFLTDFHGDLIYKDHKLYDDLLSTLQQREMFAQQFSQNSFQPTPEMADQIAHIAELYYELIQRLYSNRREASAR